MKLETFERRAMELWEAIPAAFREGVSAFIVEPGTFRKEEFEEGWVYGYCEPDEAVMALPDAPVTSRITLFYGSFVHIASTTPDFDWEEELWETIRHELQHHLEWRAGDDHLGDDDDLQDENERRVTGLPFTPDFHRYGTPLPHDAWLADHDLFVEASVPSKQWATLATQGWSHVWWPLELSVPPVDASLLSEGLLYCPADVVELQEEGAAWPWDEVVLVLRRKRSWWPW